MLSGSRPWLAEAELPVVEVGVGTITVGMAAGVRLEEVVEPPVELVGAVAVEVEPEVEADVAEEEEAVAVKVDRSATTGSSADSFSLMRRSASGASRHVSTSLAYLATRSAKAIMPRMLLATSMAATVLLLRWFYGESCFLGEEKSWEGVEVYAIIDDSVVRANIRTNGMKLAPRLAGCASTAVGRLHRAFIFGLSHYWPANYILRPPIARPSLSLKLPYSQAVSLEDHMPLG